MAARGRGQNMKQPGCTRGKTSPAATRTDRGIHPKRGTSAATATSGEFTLLARVRAAVEKIGRGRGVVVGIGDDCAVVEVGAASSGRGSRGAASGRGASRGRALQVLTTDSMIEGVHFRAGWLTPRELGVRAFRAAVSDIAAMGARPRYVLLSLEVPGDGEGFGSREALALVRALAADAQRTGAALVGGNVSGADRVGLTVTVLGEPVAKPILRSGARAGDFVFVTGSLGGAAAGCRALAARGSKQVAPAASARYRRPPLRLDFGAGLAARGIATSMVDVSDGLLQDLGHLAGSSGVSIRVDSASVPIDRAAAGDLELALGGGEDYELAFTAPESACEAIEELAAEWRVPVSVIGLVGKGRASVGDLAGRPFVIAAKGFDHLRPKRAKGSVRASDARKRR